jgi:outer membrane receptor protein involved in Fe transport
LRGTLSHDIREGSFEELFVKTPRGAQVTDRFNNDEQYTIFNLTGGNPDLEAEEADTTVVGFVYQPSFVEGLSFSLDRYVVDLTSAIGTYTEQQTIDECIATGTLCDRISFGADGRISTILVKFVNINAAKVKGYDMEASYRLEPDFFSAQAESMNFRLIAGYMDENSTTPLGGSTLDQAGSASLPKETLTANAMYSIGDVGISLQQTWLGDSVRNVQWVEGRDVDSNRVGSVNLTNMLLFWNGETNSGTWRASLNVTNLFNRDPVIAGPTRVGDDVGRRYSIGFDYSFN